MFALHVILSRRFFLTFFFFSSSAKIPHKKNVQPSSIILARDRPRVLLIKNEDWSWSEKKKLQQNRTKTTKNERKDTHGQKRRTPLIWDIVRSRCILIRLPNKKIFQVAAEYILFIRTVYRFCCNSNQTTKQQKKKKPFPLLVGFFFLSCYHERCYFCLTIRSGSNEMAMHGTAIRE